MNHRPLNLLIIDDDPIFRIGLGTALASFSDLQVVAQVDEYNAALTSLAEQAPDLVILEPGLKSGSGWQLCQQLKQNYPNLPIVLLTAITEPQLLLAARNLGVEGYCPKGVAIASLVAAIRQVGSGQRFWEISPGEPSISPLLPSARQSRWLTRLHQSGLEQIEANLAQVTQQINQPSHSLFDQLFWQGRRRELLAARWLVNQLLPVEVIFVSPQPSSTNGTRAKSLSIPPPTSWLSPNLNQLSNLTKVYELTLTKMQSGLVNLTETPLEIDILQPTKKRELLYLIFEQFAKTLEELGFLEISVAELPTRKELILKDLWQRITIDFFTKYYNPTKEGTDYQIVNILLRDAEVIQSEILNKIPFVVELFAYLLGQQSLTIEQIEYRHNAPEVIAKAEIILQNLLTQIANGVIQVILNNFSELELIKQSLFALDFISTREIARFRNNLSWKYRQEKYWQEPKQIFESQYRLFYFQDQGIKSTFIYAPRQEELAQLRGIPLIVTLLLEARDSIAPRLRSLVAFVGSGLVYLLTQVIGRGLGLIGRGIIQGIGNSLQESRYENKK